MNNIDSTLYNLQPSPAISLQVPLQSNYAAASSSPAVNQAWGPQMWALVDKEMTLKECMIYSYVPEEDPYDGEEGAIWSLNYFFFNKTRKRVAYFYVRGIPVMSHSPRSTLAKRGAGLSRDYGAKKRARYWLGDRADAVTNGGDLDGREADLDLWNPEDEDDIEFDESLDGDEYCDDYDEADDEPDEQVCNGPIRGVSEDIASQMEME